MVGPPITDDDLRDGELVTAPVMRGNQKYVDGKVSETMTYLQAELNVLEAVRNYDVASRLLKQFPERAMPVIKANIPADKEGEDLNRTAYCTEISKKLGELSKGYGPTDGSFWESLGEELKGLSAKVLHP